MPAVPAKILRPAHRGAARSPFTALLLPALASPAAAALLFTDTPALLIPDDAATGLARTLTVTETGFIQSVSVSLEIAAVPADGGFLGDLYVYLQHGEQLVTLLNRPGRQAGLPAGYGDAAGLSVTFRDGPLNPDSHHYRLALHGSHTLPLAGPLTGEWSPDGRATDPAETLSGHDRPLQLGLFDGLAADGVWTLFVADLSGGGAHRLESWTLALEITPVPEPEAVFGFFGGLVMLAACLRRTGRLSGIHRT